MSSENKPKKDLKELWIEALFSGYCPIMGCDISTNTCSHLDRYLAYTSETYTDKKTKKVKRVGLLQSVPLLLTNDIDDFSMRLQPQAKEGLTVWGFYKKIKRYGLGKDQVGILVRRFVLNMTFRQIMKDMGWVSRSHLDRRYFQALADLKSRGYKEGSK